MISYYTEKPVIDIIVLAHQEITQEWWRKGINRFNIYISEIVVEEASYGDPEAAKRLTIQCVFLAGGQQVKETLSYDVFHGIFVSSANSSDTYPGAADQPKRIIQGAIRRRSITTVSSIVLTLFTIIIWQEVISILSPMLTTLHSQKTISARTSRPLWTRSSVLLEIFQ